MGFPPHFSHFDGKDVGILQETHPFIDKSNGGPMGVKIGYPPNILFKAFLIH